MFKLTSTILIVVLYLSLSTGLYIHIHWCGGQLASVVFNSNDSPSCCCNHEEDEENNCCEDSEVEIKLTESPKPSTTFVLQIVFPSSQTLNYSTTLFHSIPIKKPFILSKTIYDPPPIRELHACFII